MMWRRSAKNQEPEERPLALTSDTGRSAQAESDGWIVEYVQSEWAGAPRIGTSRRKSPPMFGSKFGL